MEKRNRKNDNFILSIWYALKRCMAIFIAIVILGTAGGLVYGFVKKPDYTAKEQIVFTAKALENGNPVINVNIMRAYANTIIDFCDEGVVLDRANFYYVTYKSRVEDPNKGYLDQKGKYSVDDFIDDIETVEDPKVVVGTEKHIIKENVYVSATVETDEQDVYAFSLGYTDSNQEEAKIKTKILVLAFMREIQPAPNTTGVKYFEGINITITKLSKGELTATSNVSKVATTIKGFILGLVVAIIVTYVVNVTDVTIKDKDDLEEITGADVLAYIQDQGGKK